MTRFNAHTRTLLLKLSAATIVTALSLGAGSAPVYAQSMPMNDDIALHVQPVNMRALHDQLNLTPDQEVQWQSAMDAMRQSHAAERMNADQLQARTQTMLQQPILDLSALHALHEKTGQQDAPLAGQSANAWLTFYGGLTAQQKKTFSDAMRPQFENVVHHPARPYEPRTGL